MIEKMVLFENQKQLEETRDELERCKRFSFRLYAKELPLELTLSHEENNEVNAVKAILKDMEKGNWPMLHYFRMHCKSDSNPPKILQANAIGCVMMSLRYLTARNISASEFKKKIFDWDEDGEGYETYQRRVRALASKTKKVEQIKMNHTEEFPFNLICPYQFIPTMKKNEKVKEFLTPFFSAATKHIVEENRDSVSWNVLRLAEKEKEIFDESDTGSLEKQKKNRLKDRCEDLCVAIEKMSKVDLSQKGNHSETVVLYFARENIYHCEKLNRIGKEKIDQRTARLIIHKSCYPMAFYLDEIIEKYEGAAFMCQYGRYLNMVAVALVEYAYENLKFKKGSATYWQAIQEAERILGNYIDEYWDYYFSFLDKKEKTFLISEEVKPRISDDAISAIYMCFLNRDILYKAPDFDFDVIPQYYCADGVPPTKYELNGPIESIVSKLHNGFIIVQNSENQKEEQDKFTEALKEQELLQVEEKTLRLKPLGVDDNWERLLKVFGKTKKSIRVKDFRYERVWKSGRIEAICGWKNPQLMKNWMEKNGVEIPEVESESLDTEVDYKVIMKLLMAGSNDFGRAKIRWTIRLGKIKNCIKGNDYMYYWEWEPELTDGGKLLKYEAVQAEKRIASYTSEKI